MLRRIFLFCALSLVACKKAEPDLPEYGPVGQFSLRDQSGKSFGSAELSGKVWVAAFMFTRCPTICPVITRRMKTLQDQAKQRGIALELVSISVDPEHDTPEVLTRYAEQYGADPASWHFVTGDYDTVKKTSVEGFKTALEGKADAKAEDFGILHGSNLILVDREGRFRGFYRTKDDPEIARLLHDAERLTK